MQTIAEPEGIHYKLDALRSIIMLTNMVFVLDVAMLPFDDHVPEYQYNQCTAHTYDSRGKIIICNQGKSLYRAKIFGMYLYL